MSNLIKHLLQLMGILSLASGLIALVSPTLFLKLLSYLPAQLGQAVAIDTFYRSLPLSWSLLIAGLIILWTSSWITGGR